MYPCTLLVVRAGFVLRTARRGRRGRRLHAQGAPVGGRPHYGPAALDHCGRPLLLTACSCAPVGHASECAWDTLCHSARVGTSAAPSRVWPNRPTGTGSAAWRWTCRNMLQHKLQHMLQHIATHVATEVAEEGDWDSKKHVALMHKSSGRCTPCSQHALTRTAQPAHTDAHMCAQSHRNIREPVC